MIHSVMALDLSFLSSTDEPSGGETPGDLPGLGSGTSGSSLKWSMFEIEAIRFGEERPSEYATASAAGP